MGIEKIKEILSKMGGREKDEVYVPKQVVDRRLDGLRRLSEVQDNEIEKERLIKKIADFNRERTAKHLFGIKGKINEAKKEGLIKAIKKKKVNILSNENSILSGKSILSGDLDNKKQEFKKKPVNILTDNSSFLR